MTGKKTVYVHADEGEVYYFELDALDHGDEPIRISEPCIMTAAVDDLAKVIQTHLGDELSPGDEIFAKSPSGAIKRYVVKEGRRLSESG